MDLYPPAKSERRDGQAAMTIIGHLTSQRHVKLGFSVFHNDNLDISRSEGFAVPVQKIIAWWRNSQPVHLLLGLLIALTAAMLIWQHFGMNLYLRLDPQHIHKVKASGDQENLNGNSVGRLTTTPDYWRLDCQLNSGHRAPFCSLDLDLSHGDQGIDLSVFDQITIQYRYQKLREQINLIVVNFNPDYSKTNQYESQKFNELFLPGAPGWVKRDVSASQFNVAAWWMANNHMEPQWGENEFSNIREIRLATGLYPQEKQHQIDLAYIEFSGKWISAHRLYLILLILWGSSARHG